MKRISLVGQKGGVGKSTLAISLAVEFAERGWRVLLVDIDTQASSLEWAQRGEPRERLDVVGAGPGYERMLEAQTAYDLVVLDSPGNDSAETRRAVLASHIAIYPMKPSALDLWTQLAGFARAREAQMVAPKLQLRAVVNMAHKGQKSTRDMPGVFEQASISAFSTFCHEYTSWSAGMAGGLSPTEFDPESKAAREVHALADEVMQLLNPPPKEQACAS